MLTAIFVGLATDATGVGGQIAREADAVTIESDRTNASNQSDTTYQQSKPGHASADDSNGGSTSSGTAATGRAQGPKADQRDHAAKRGPVGNTAPSDSPDGSR
jgi:hypothetical protein